MIWVLLRFSNQILNLSQSQLTLFQKNYEPVEISKGREKVTQSNEKGTCCTEKEWKEKIQKKTSIQIDIFDRVNLWWQCLLDKIFVCILLWVTNIYANNGQRNRYKTDAYQQRLLNAVNSRNCNTIQITNASWSRVILTL